MRFQSSAVHARQRHPRVDAKGEMRLGLYAACGPDRAARPPHCPNHSRRASLRPDAASTTTAGYMRMQNRRSGTGTGAVAGSCRFLPNSAQGLFGLSAVGYSITSSARASSVGGTSRPSALALLRLMTKSNLVGCITGRSAGFSPLRIRPV